MGRAFRVLTSSLLTSSLAAQVSIFQGRQLGPGARLSRAQLSRAQFSQNQSLSIWHPHHQHDRSLMIKSMWVNWPTLTSPWQGAKEHSKFWRRRAWAARQNNVNTPTSRHQQTFEIQQMSSKKPTKSPCLRSWRITVTGFASKLIYPKNSKSFNVKFTLADCSPCFGNLPDKNQIVLSPLYFQRNLVGNILDKYTI